MISVPSSATPACTAFPCSWPLHGLSCHTCSTLSLGYYPRWLWRCCNRHREPRPSHHRPRWCIFRRSPLPLPWPPPFPWPSPAPSPAYRTCQEFDLFILLPPSRWSLSHGLHLLAAGVATRSQVLCLRHEGIHSPHQPSLVDLADPSVYLHRNSSLSVSRLSYIPQTSVTKTESRTAAGPAPAGVCPTSVGAASSEISLTAALHSALPDSDRPMSALMSTSVLLMAYNRNAWIPRHLLNFECQFFHGKRLTFHVSP